MTDVTIDFTVVDTPFGPIGLAATAAGLAALAPVVADGDEPRFGATRDMTGLGPLFALARRGRPAARFVEHPADGPLPPRLAEAVAALRAYLAGTPRPDVALDLAGTPFQLAVWRALLEIPYGATVTYGELAARLGRPGAARAVGAAVGANPVSLLVPCHRVVGAGGSLTGFGWGLALKRRLLAHEQQGALTLTA
ncbi:MAG TPA: methylated-DNA--[protein]-cysteine S-methyltransferase [Thermodesulfobacteriota bacterium]